MPILKNTTLRGGESATILIHGKSPKCLVIPLDSTPLSTGVQFWEVYEILQNAGGASCRKVLIRPHCVAESLPQF